MQNVKALFASDAVKQVLAALALANGAILASASVPSSVKVWCGIAASVFAALGIISGGTTGTQPVAVQQAIAPQSDAQVILPIPQGPPRGFATFEMLCLLSALGVLGCAALSKSTVDTGDVDLGKGVVSRTTSAPTDPVSCTQLWTQNVTFPLPKSAAGECLLDDIAVSIPFQPGKGAKCKVSASPGTAACTKLVSTSCAVPIPRDAAGACP